MEQKGTNYAVEIMETINHKSILSGDQGLENYIPGWNEESYQWG